MYMKPNNMLAVAIIITLAGLLVILFVVKVRGDNERRETPQMLYDDFKADAEHAEGRLDYVYLLNGVKHAGIGHKLVGDETKWAVGARVYDEQVDEWFRADYARVMHGVERYFHDFDSYPHLAKLAILNWLYQLGPDAPIKFPHATAAINAEDWITAANEWEYVSKAKLRKSKWFNETPHRCMQECERLRSVGLTKGLYP